MAQDFIKRTMGRIASLQPEARRRCELLVIMAADQGIPIRVTETLRSPEVQAAYFAQGRMGKAEVNRLRVTAGLAPLGPLENNRIITNARAGTSNHETGMAFDVVPMKFAARLLPDWAYPGWSTIGEIGKRLGLKWGGDWSKPDRPHFEYKP